MRRPEMALPRGPRSARGPVFFSAAEVAELLDVPVARIEACLHQAKAREAFFRGALEVDEGWRIPATDVRMLLGGGLEPLLSMSSFAEICGVSYSAIARACSEGRLPRLRLPWLDEVRIPASEYWRARGKADPRRALA